MKLRLCLFLAAISAMLAALPAGTARRPCYGGTLRVEIGAAVVSVDPAAPAASMEEVVAREQIDALIYARRNPDGTFAGAAGSGPFCLAEWEPGKHAALAANDDFSAGRPFVDSIDIQMGRAAKDRLLDLELGKADFAEIPPEQARRAAESGVRVSASKPDELLALVFYQGRPTTQDARMREAIARAVDRAATVSFILQKQGEPAGGLLPQWSSGTAFLFPAAADPAGAKELRAQIGASPRIVLGYDSGGALEESVAKRIAVDAQAAGISLVAQGVPAAPALSGSSAPPDVDVALIRWRMPSSHPRDALEDLLAVLGPMAGVDPAPLPEAASPGEIYARERAVVSGGWIVPLVWLPEVYGLSARVRDWITPAPGEAWPLADVWLDQETP
jgi:ABC-type transport system substrate-binding protein